MQRPVLRIITADPPALMLRAQRIRLGRVPQVQHDDQVSACFPSPKHHQFIAPLTILSARTGIYHVHASSCTGERTACSEDDGAKRAALSRRHDRNNPLELNSPEVDGRIRCKCCDRAFHEDRIGKHQSVCVGPPPSRSSDRSKIIQLSQTTLGRPKSTTPTSSVRSLAGSCRTATTSKDFRARTSLGVAGNRHAAAERSTQQRPGCFTRHVEARRYDVVIRDSGHQGSFGRTSSGYPGASRMEAGRWESTSNASSAGNPLVTNRMMTVSSVDHSF